MSSRSRRRRLVPLLVSGVAMIAAAAGCGSAQSGTAQESVTLKLRGGRNETARACDQTHPHRYKLYRVNTTLSMEGWVVPAPAQPDTTRRVKIKFKQCKGGSFVTVAQVHVKGTPVVVNGRKEVHFAYSRPLPVRGFFFARAYYYGYTPSLISADAYYSVTP